MVNVVFLLMGTSLFLFVMLVVFAAGRVAMRAVGEMMLVVSVAVISGGFFVFSVNYDFEGFLLFVMFGLLFLFIGGALKISGEVASERSIVREVNRRIIMEKIKPSVTGD